MRVAHRKGQPVSNLNTVSLAVIGDSIVLCPTAAIAKLPYCKVTA